MDRDSKAELSGMHYGSGQLDRPERLYRLNFYAVRLQPQYRQEYELADRCALLTVFRSSRECEYQVIIAVPGCRYLQAWPAAMFEDEEGRPLNVLLADESKVCRVSP
jgi:hypothetical protein